MDMRNEFTDMTDGSVVFVIADAEILLKTNIQIMDILLKNRSGLYVTVNEPYDSLEKIMKRNRIDAKNMFFIDCVTKQAGGLADRTDKCLYMASPGNLTEISIAISEVLHAMPGNRKFLFLDSLNTLLVYNSKTSVAKFSHYSSNRIKILGHAGVFTSAENQMDDMLVKQISEFCSKVVRV